MTVKRFSFMPWWGSREDQRRCGTGGVFYVVKEVLTKDVYEKSIYFSTRVFYSSNLRLTSLINVVDMVVVTEILEK